MKIEQATAATITELWTKVEPRVKQAQALEEGAQALANADHGRAVIREELAGVRPRDRTAELQDAKLSEALGHGSVSRSGSRRRRGRAECGG